MFVYLIALLQNSTLFSIPVLLKWMTQEVLETLDFRKMYLGMVEINVSALQF